MIAILIASILFHLATHIFAELEFKSKGISNWKKDIKEDVQLSLIALFRVMAETREYHLKTDAYMVNYYSMFVNMGFLLYLCSIVHSSVLPLEPDFLQDWLIAQLVLFKTTGVLYSLIIHFNVRNLLFLLIERSTNPNNL